MSPTAPRSASSLNVASLIRSTTSTLKGAPGGCIRAAAGPGATSATPVETRRASRGRTRIGLTIGRILNERRKETGWSSGLVAAGGGLLLGRRLGVRLAALAARRAAVAILLRRLALAVVGRVEAGALVVDGDR